MEVVLYIDAAIAVNEGSSAQAGILAMLRDKLTGIVNIIHYEYLKSKRVCKSILAARLSALADGFDVRFTIRHVLTAIMKRKINLDVYTDSRPLYGLCLSLAHTTERRLQIFFSLLREAYERRETD